MEPINIKFDLPLNGNGTMDLMGLYRKLEGIAKKHADGYVGLYIKVNGLTGLKPEVEFSVHMNDGFRVRDAKNAEELIEKITKIAKDHEKVS